MSSIPEELQSSKALQFIVSQGWNFKQVNPPRITIESCPYCGKDGFHLAMEVHAADDEERNRDGLHSCIRCGKSGNLNSLKVKLGVSIPGVEGRKDWGGGAGKEADKLPDVSACHAALMEDEEALDYLVNGRGFSLEIIQKQKLGLKADHFFRETGKVRALVYPYLVGGNCVWAHYRSLPTMPLCENKVPKAFSSPSGWDSTLYNGEILLPGLSDLVMVEGEANCISAMDKGFGNIVGVPGANFKKAAWIDTLDKLGLERIYICYDGDKIGQRAAQVLASRIGIERCYKISLPIFSVTTDQGVTRLGKDLNEWFSQGGGTAEAFEQLKQDATLFDVEGVTGSGDALQEFHDEILGKGITPKYTTAWTGVNKYIGFDDGDVIDILAPAKIGKAQPLYSQVLTPTGYLTMGAMRVGDKLASVDGKESIVTGVFPQGMRDVFRLTFSDGRIAEADGEHLWSVSNISADRKSQIFTTNELIERVNKGQKWYVPLAAGEWGQEKPFPIHPWLLGVLLGDGDITNPTPSVHKLDEFIREKTEGIVKSYGMHTTKLVSGFRIRGASIGGAVVKDNSLTLCLKELSLYGKDCYHKFIPQMYLSGSRQQRLELLQGLMDTDGTVGKKGATSFSTSSHTLAYQVQFLVRSLGGISSVSWRVPTFSYKGEKRLGALAYRVSVQLSSRENVFSLPRKKELAKGVAETKLNRLTIKSIEFVGHEEVQCIRVSHPSQLYITDGFTVTHNTTFALNMVEHMVNQYGDDGIFICLEMTRAKMARKWLAHVSQIDDNNVGLDEEDAEALKQKFLHAIPEVQAMVANRPGELYFCSPTYRSMDDLYNLIRQVIRRYGVKWVVFDNIQRAADTTSQAKGANRAEHLSQISKVLSQIAKEFNVCMVRILQPKKIERGRIAGVGDTDGSGAIDKDCDCMLTLHRTAQGELTVDDFEQQGFVDEESSFGNEMFVGIPISRYSSGGRTTLYYDGAKSTIKSFADEQIKTLADKKAAKLANVGHEAQLKKLGIEPKVEAKEPPKPIDPKDGTVEL